MKKQEDEQYLKKKDSSVHHTKQSMSGNRFCTFLGGSCALKEYMLLRSGGIYSRVCGWECGSSCLWDFYSETTVVERGSRGVAASMASNVLSSSSFIDTVQRIS